MILRRYINRASLSRVIGSNVANRIADRFGARPSGLPPIDIIDYYAFVRERGFGAKLTQQNMPESNTINWFVPPIGRGSGGHLNILRFIRNLEELGFKSRIIVCDQPNAATCDQIKKNIEEWFFPISAAVYVHPGLDIPPAFTSIATGWQTAYPVRNFRATVNRAYFVQDFEPYFYPFGSEYVLAENTYRFGLAGITAGGWLKRKLSDDYGMQTTSFGFSYDADLYKPLPKRPQERKHVFVYARPVTPRRGFELIMLALEQVAAQIPDIGVIFAGWDVGSYKMPFVRHNAGSVALNELPDLYSQCDVALVLSLTNLSLLPLELMACGCPVVSNRGENVEWLLSPDNSELTELTPEGLSTGIVKVLTNDEHRRSLAANGLAFAQQSDWMKEARTVAQFLQELSA